MRVLLDTNIVLDYLGANQGFTEDSDKVFDLGTVEKLSLRVKMDKSSKIKGFRESGLSGYLSTNPKEQK